MNLRRFLFSAAIAAVSLSAFALTPQKDPSKPLLGLVDASGQWIVKPKFTHIDSPVPGYFRVVKGNKAGLIAEDGTVLIAPKEFTSIVPYGNYFKVSKNDKTGLYDPASHGLITHVKYSDVDFPITVDNRTFVPVKTTAWGVADNLGNLILQPAYDKITVIKPLDALLLEAGRGSRYLFYPAKGEQVDLSNFKQTAVGPFTTISADVRRGGSKIAIIADSDGNVVSSKTSDIDLVAGRYIIREGQTCSVFDTDGQLLADGLPVPYELTGNMIVFGSAKALMPGNSLRPVKKIGKLLAVADIGGYLPLFGGKSAGTAYEDIVTTDNEGVFAIRKDGKWGLINDVGTILHDCDLDQLPTYNADLAGFVIKDGDKMGVLDKVPARFDEIVNRSDLDAYFVRSGDLWGIYDLFGNQVVEPTYTVLNPNGIANQLWAGLPGDKWGVIDTYGNIIVPVNYPDACLNIIEDRFYEILQNGSTYYNSNGEKLSGKPRIEVTYQNMIHNNWDSNDNKGFKLEYNFDTEFLLEAPIYVEILVFNRNGTPAKNSKGSQIKYGTWKTPSYLFSRYEDQWFTMPYAQFVQPRGTKRDYYVQLRFYDQNKRPLPTTGNSKIEFYLTR